jgi:hypothetical protein
LQKVKKFGIGIKQALSDMSIIRVLHCRRSSFTRRIHQGAHCLDLDLIG